MWKCSYADGVIRVEGPDADSDSIYNSIGRPVFCSYVNNNNSWSYLLLTAFLLPSLTYEKDHVAFMLSSLYCLVPWNTCWEQALG